MKKKALIYARVSSVRQAQEGHGLDGQELRCRAFATANGYEIDKVFHDSFSGGGDFMLRPAMVELIAYIDAYPHVDFVVVFDDISRLARDVVQHVRLRSAFDERGVGVKCPNFNFEDSPEGEMVELILAAQSQYHRKNNKRQVVQKMKARLERGFWTFNASCIPGYVRRDDVVHGWILVRKEPEATVIQEAFEGFVSGRFQEQKDVQTYLQTNDFKKGKKVHLSQVERMFRRVLYAGYIEHPQWDVSRRKGQHEAIISLETFEKVQDKINGKAGIRTRKDTTADFPLRGFLKCEHCKKLFTAAWSRGNGGKNPYYRCNNQNCIVGNKSIRRKKIHDSFEDLLKGVTPTAEALELTKALFEQRWDKKIGEVGGTSKVDEKRLISVQSEIESLSLRAAKAKNETLAEVYERQIEKLSNEQLLLAEKVEKQTITRDDFGTALDEVFGVLKSPYNYWVSGGIDDKRLALKLVFAEQAAYCSENGFGTANLSLPVKVFELVGTGESRDVEMAGVEPASELGCDCESTVRSSFF
jgi:site-specific DNA recombinase